MQSNFLKFKRRVRLQTVLSSAFIGLGSGALAYAVTQLVMKLSGSDAPPLLIAIFAASAALISVALYFIFMPSDRRLAKRLDNLYSLDEKISTMVELRHRSDGFAELQREDADRRLGEKPKRELKSKQLIAGLLVFFIAAGSAVGATLMPVRADAGETPIDEFDKQWIITAITELISTVENSYIDEQLRESVLDELNSLLSFVTESDLLSQMKAEAIKALIGINDALTEANSAELIAEQFSGSADEALKELGKELSELSGTGSKKALLTYGESMAESGREDAAFGAEEITAYLKASGVRSDDGLYLLFTSLAAVLKNDFSEIEDSFDEAGKELSSAVILQNVNRATIEIVINELCNIFGITEADISRVDPNTDIEIRDPSLDEEIPDDSEVEEPDNDISSGGLGTGEVVYGSNDLVFDPDTNTYRPYGELINDYYAKANELIRDGKVTDKVSEATEEYFDSLFGSPTDEE